jgi:NifB/MoaA-like Fe-S oxidoreductase
MAAAIQRKTGLCCLVRMIKNEFFGGAVTVAGLVVGRDIIKQLEGCDLGSALFLPSVMLRAGEDVFLDDTTLSELEEKLGVPVVRVTPDASAASEICEYAETLKKG